MEQAGELAAQPTDGDRSLRAASRAETGPLAAALASAFLDDPIFSWMIPDRNRRLRRLPAFFALELRHVVMPAGRALTTQGLQGACLELPPGAWKMPIRAQAFHGPSFLRIFGARLPHAMALLSVMERRHLREPHYYIPYVGVAAVAQGQGLGTALLRRTLERCDSEGLPAYLEASSERNVTLYERLGFEHLGRLTFAGSPPLWRMRRPPGKSPATH